MSFIPVIKLNSKLNSESCLKYFIIQSVRSRIIIMGVIIISLNFKFNLIIIFSLIIKLGIIPFHNWVVSIVDGIGYTSLLIIFSLLKLAPLNIIFYLNYDLQIFVIIGLWISSISALNKNSIKKILCYSSIYNLSVCLRCINDYSIWILYIIFYIITNFLLIFLLYNLNLKFINQIIINNFNSIIKISLFIIIISMGGIPPLFIFLGKLIVIENLLLKLNLIISLCIIFSSLLSIFFYIRISIISIIFFSLFIKWMLFINFNIIIMFRILILFSSPIFLIIKSFN